MKANGPGRVARRQRRCLKAFPRFSDSQIRSTWEEGLILDSQFAPLRQIQRHTHALIRNSHCI
jgi:hypothetical protein